MKDRVPRAFFRGAPDQARLIFFSPLLGASFLCSRAVTHIKQQLQPLCPLILRYSRPECLNAIR